MEYTKATQNVSKQANEATAKTLALNAKRKNVHVPSVIY
jgi:hypothetical protein